MKTSVDRRVSRALMLLSLFVGLAGCGGGSSTGSGGSGAAGAGGQGGGAGKGGVPGVGGTNNGGAAGSSNGGGVGGTSNGGAGGASNGVGGKGGASNGGAGGASNAGSCISAIQGTCLVSIDGSGVTSSCVEFAYDGSAICAASNGIGTMKTTYVAGSTKCPTANLEGCCNTDLTSIGGTDTQTCFYPSHPNHGKQQQACLGAGSAGTSWCTVP